MKCTRYDDWWIGRLSYVQFSQYHRDRWPGNTRSLIVSDLKFITWWTCVFFLLLLLLFLFCESCLKSTSESVPAEKNIQRLLMIMYMHIWIVCHVSCSYWWSRVFAHENFVTCAVLYLSRRELSIWGVKVSILNPGLFRTGLINVGNFREARERQWAALPAELREQYGEDFKEKGTISRIYRSATEHDISYSTATTNV